jgi:DNA-binding Lrp family transcriptional regulator
MRLSEKEATILACAELRADASMALLRKESGYREHTVRYALHRLLERGVIAPVPFINLHRLGYTIYSIFFSSGSERKGSKDSAVKSFIAAPDVLWVGEFGGEYQYGVAFCTKRLATVVQFLHSLSRRHQQIFFEKAISVQISSTIFPRKYLTSKRFTVEPITVTFGESVVEIDQLDARILSALTSFGNLSHRQVALKLGIPLSTMELRFKKLRERGVIAENIYVIDPAAFNKQSFKLLVYTKGLDPQLTGQMHKFCAQHRDITYLIECLGSWGYEIGVEVSRGEEVTAVMQELYEFFGNSINTIKMLTKFRYPKVRWFPEQAAV